MRNSVGRLGHPETTTLREPVRPGTKRDPRLRVLGSRQTRSFLALTRGVRTPGFLDDAANQRAARVAEMGAGWRIGLALFCSAQICLL